LGDPAADRAHAQAGSGAPDRNRRCQLVDLSEDVDSECDHVGGTDDAAVTLVEYGDHEWPHLR
jgi:hypothetical protein